MTGVFFDSRTVTIVSSASSEITEGIYYVLNIRFSIIGSRLIRIKLNDNRRRPSLEIDSFFYAVDSFKSSSRGDDISLSTESADAPGYGVTTVITSKLTLGNTSF